jgi:hypothetical protein
MEELWELYLDAYEIQERRHEVNTGPTHDKGQRLITAIKELENAWAAFTPKERDLFLQYGIDQFSVHAINTLFTDDRAVVPSEFYRRDTNMSHALFTQKLKSTLLAIDSAVTHDGYRGRPEKTANKALALYLLRYWMDKTGEKPVNLREHASVKFVESMVEKLQNHVDKPNETRKSVIELMAFENVNSTCTRLITDLQLEK